MNKREVKIMSSTYFNWGLKKNPDSYRRFRKPQAHMIFP